MDDDRPFKISLIEMDAKHERYGEIEITDYYTTIKLNIPAYGTLPTMPRYEAFLGAYDAIRLGNLLISAGLRDLDRQSAFDPDDHNDDV